MARHATGHEIVLTRLKLTCPVMAIHTKTKAAMKRNVVSRLFDLFTQLIPEICVSSHIGIDNTLEFRLDGTKINENACYAVIIL